MTDSTTPRSRGIHLLRDEVSRRIAAGEVIDRPLSIVRELVDNALDAGASSIDVFLEGGGTGRVRVVDDGGGMGPEDLALCWQPHATSKIETEDDLLRVRTLGFRGEALSSIALCSRMVVTSCAGAAATPWRLEVRGGRPLPLEPAQGRPGTVVDVSEIFHDYPARRKFLRSPSAESALCRSIMVDRAVAHPAAGFRLSSDGDLKLALPPAGQVERVAAAWSSLVDARLLGSSAAEGDGFSVRAVLGSPELRRRDRRLLQAFVNGRRVGEFGLLQAVEHGFSGFVPGGWYPAGFVFVTIDPGLVDFNIHPAKKEVRFRNLPDVHRAVVQAVRAFLEPRAPRGTAPAGETDRDGSVAGRPGALPLVDAGRLPGPQAYPLPPLPLPPRPRGGGETGGTTGTNAAGGAEGEVGIRFLGQVFGVFLLFELPGRLLMLDQHAAHERVIYERLMASAPRMQEMLFPLVFDAAEDEARRLEGSAAELAGMGVALRAVGSRSVEVTALSEDYASLPEHELVELLRGAGAGEWRHAFRAGAACRMAVRDGEPLDALTATELCRQALGLPVPRCPHGRPVWHELREDGLRAFVDRPPRPGDPGPGGPGPGGPGSRRGG